MRLICVYESMMIDYSFALLRFLLSQTMQPESDSTIMDNSFWSIRQYHRVLQTCAVSLILADEINFTLCTALTFNW